MKIQDNRSPSYGRAVYTVDEIRVLLGIGEKKTYELVKSRKFPCIRLGKRLLIPKEPFHQWLNQEGVESE